MNTSEFLIETSDLELAQKIGETISDKSLRNRAVASVFAVNIASKFFDSEKYDIDTISGLHNIPNIHSDIDIADLYINGNYIDVRIFFEGDTPCVPCSLINRKIDPIAFSFIKVDTEFSNAEVIGFIRPEDIDTQNILNNQVIIDEANLTSFYDIEPYLINNEDFIEIDDTILDDLLTGKINDNQVFKNLTKSKEARLRLAKLAKAQYIFNFISISKDFNNENLGNKTDISLDLDKSELTPGKLDSYTNEDNFDLRLENDNIADFNDNINIEETSDFDLQLNDDIADFNDDINIDLIYKKMMIMLISMII